MLATEYREVLALLTWPTSILEYCAEEASSQSQTASTCIDLFKSTNQRLRDKILLAYMGNIVIYRNQVLTTIIITINFIEDAYVTK